jgi:hypothetical protein
MKDFSREAKRVGEVFELLIKEQDSTRLNVWIEMIEKEIIRQRGYTDGRAAGTWVFDGNTQEAHFKRIQQGVKDGDPMYIDMLPQPSIGGEFAGEQTWDDLVAEELFWEKEAVQYMDTQELHDTYCEAFGQGVEDEVMAYGQHSVKVI